MHGIEKEITGLQTYLDGLIEKKNRLQAASVLAYDEEKRFVLEKQVEGITNEANEVRERLQKMSSNLPTFPTSSLKKSTSSLKKAFLSYSRLDRSYLEELKRHLAPLIRTGKIVLFDDSYILPGETWDTKLRSELTGADLILMLVSANFMATDYIWDIEVPAAMELHENGSAVVIPIVISPCIWDDMPFSMLNALPGKALPVSDFADRNTAWAEVVKGIKRVIESV